MIHCPPQPYSRQESQQDLVLGGDMPISSIQATIAKLSIRTPSLSDQPADAPWSLEDQPLPAGPQPLQDAGPAPEGPQQPP